MTSLRLFTWTSVLVLLTSSSNALAQTGPIPPFVGEQFEGFETQFVGVGGQHPPGGTTSLIGGLFDGTASLSTSGGSILIQLSGSTFSTCSSVHRTGSFQLGCFLGGCSIQFTSDQAALGGYFATDNSTAQDPFSREWDVRFFDASGNSIGIETFLISNQCGQYEWQGWSLPSGTRRVTFEGRLPNKTLLMDDLMVSPTLPLGRAHCVSEETSLEERGYCGATGSSSAASNAVSLHATQLPPNAFGFFLASRDAGLVVHPGGSAGTLCLGGSIGRYVGPGQIQNSGASGSFSLPLDLTAIPQPNGAVPAQAGETWRFQAWFRDVTTTSPPIPTSNFTSGLEITWD
ncbi:hypothetical protein Poly30_45650 [Planctomycetes bacterium Poly30]|uniref:Uncharacterized protein n=1 Tax=Saltatorellus ferox TaxID=2528018 RepID=A0A518EY50_9BACT|nr:hypothetical protein Poly30_45650 [Planctomycetes bacterium Poly30]